MIFSILKHLLVNFPLSVLGIVGGVPTLWGVSPHCGGCPHIVGGVPTLWGVSPHCGDTPIGVSPQSQKKIKESLNLGLNKKT